FHIGDAGGDVAAFGFVRDRAGEGDDAVGDVHVDFCELIFGNDAGGAGAACGDGDFDAFGEFLIRVGGLGGLVLVVAGLGLGGATDAVIGGVHGVGVALGAVAAGDIGGGAVDGFFVVGGGAVGDVIFGAAGEK